MWETDSVTGDQSWSFDLLALILTIRNVTSSSKWKVKVIGVRAEFGVHFDHSPRSTVGLTGISNKK